MLTPTHKSTPRWVSATLTLAGLYNLVWGAFVIIDPDAIFRWTGIATPRYPQIWQCVGMLVGAYGIAYLIAASDPFRHWPIVLVGLLGKVAGPIGFINPAITGALPWAWGLTIVTNDLVWWLPFAGILYLAYRHNSDPGSARDGVPAQFDEAARAVYSHRGSTIADLSSERPLMVVFLRHAGCTFCREALHDLARQRQRIESAGVELAIVHMSPPMQATRLTAKIGLDDVHRFSDPNCELYDVFGLQRGKLRQLIGWKVIWRGFMACVVNGHGMGAISGDGFRMPGVFILRANRIVARFLPATAADRPDYAELAESVADNSMATVES